LLIYSGNCEALESVKANYLVIVIYGFVGLLKAAETFFEKVV
jgi:fatty acid/phospholipid biosynthesis enzyme